MTDTTHEALTPETVNRLRKIVFYEHSTRNALIHDCALGQITMGDVQDLIAAIERVSDRIEELEAKLAQAQTWQPIETAPKDGTTFLAYWPDDLGNGFAYVVTTWFGPRATGPSDLVFQTEFEYADKSNNPTHWLPHAAPPAPPSQN